MYVDQSLWLTDGFEGGAGGDWGQRMSREEYMSTGLDGDNHIYLHEVGHTFALDGTLEILSTLIGSIWQQKHSLTN